MDFLKAYKGYITLGVLAIFAIMCISSYNGMVNSQEEVEATWGKVETEYQRRANLIPNLVETVKGFAAHEKETLEAVINARAKASAINIDPTNMTEEQLREFQKAQGELTQALGKLMVVQEQYPQLKSDTHFTEIMVELEGSENRIARHILLFNDAAKEYNSKIRRFPASILASMFGFTKRPYFEAEEGSEKAPTVKF